LSNLIITQQANDWTDKLEIKVKNKLEKRIKSYISVWSVQESYNLMLLTVFILLIQVQNYNLTPIFCSVSCTGNGKYLNLGVLSAMFDSV